jgi:ParB family chromosome partitioning protein
MIAAMPFLREKEEEVESLTAKLADAEQRLAKAIAGAFDVRLDQLVEVSGRRRALTFEQKVELRENLRHNKLTHPITVRALPDGRFEIISGHNRTDQYRELGRETIRAVPVEMTDEEAAASAFYANLLQSDLSDYEKYIGFRDMQARQPDLTQAAMAELSGLNTGVLSTLFSFGRLPSDVLALLDANPVLLGANAAQDLAGLTREGKSQAVIDAVTKLAEGRIKTQEQAIKLANAPTKSKPKAATVAKIRMGKATYCDVRLVSKTLRIDFQSEEEAARVNLAIQALLEAEAKAAKVASPDSEK